VPAEFCCTAAGTHLWFVSVLEGAAATLGAGAFLLGGGGGGGIRDVPECVLDFDGSGGMLFFRRFARASAFLVNAWCRDGSARREVFRGVEDACLGTETTDRVTGRDGDAGIGRNIGGVRTATRGLAALDCG
jgi:hypothetical protein